VVCPLLCQNGGVCLQTDRCLCPPTFTGKFCHIPVTMTPATPPSTNDIASHSEFLMPLGSHPEGASAGAPSPSMVKVRVQHPPEASVKIHQVLKVGPRLPASCLQASSHWSLCPWPQISGPGPAPCPAGAGGVHVLGVGGGSGAGGWSSADLAGGRGPAALGVQVLLPRSEGRTGEDSGHLQGPNPQPPPPRGRRAPHTSGKCSSPLPGLRSKDMCCRGIGKAWGITSCVLCPQNTGQNNNSCPAGFQRTNQTHCADVNECLLPGLCDNGLCVNTRGSYSCVCRAGFILDASHGICVSQAVISEEKGQCFRVLGSGLGPASCSLPILRNITKQICCCSRVGKAWGAACLRCPYFGSGACAAFAVVSDGRRHRKPDAASNQQSGVLIIAVATRPVSSFPPVSSEPRLGPFATTLREAQALLAKGGGGDKMAAALMKHIEKEKKKLWSVTSSEGGRLDRRPSPTADGQTGGADRIQVMFTPTICQVRCSQGRCLNSCERGNLTTLYSAGEAATGRRDGAQSPSFRVFVCPLLCQNGGVCLQTDRCLCPPTFTGKFCHIPVTMTPATPPSTNDIASHSEFLMPLGSHPGGASAGAPSPSMVKVRVQHPPEASVKIHQVLKRSEFKYCFREVKDGQVRTRDTFRVQTRSLHPPEGAGLLTPLERSKDMCCRGIGKAWGITSCVLCPQNTAQAVISEEKGQCFRVLGSGLGPASCSLPILRNITKQICCCSRVGKAWGAACLRCPYFGSAAFKELCPAGPGYQYSASAQQFNQRVSEQLGAPRRLVW
ncbi:unnamed protein product, partial [Tetraodon nigroviridis]